jgi:superfamily II DNA or RNA helicase
MADKVYIEQYNHVHHRINCEASIAMELSEHFTFFVPGYKWMPKFKMGIWDGKIRLFNFATKLIYCGLGAEIEAFCKERGYECINNTEAADDFSIHDAKGFIAELGLPFEPRDYQIKAFAQAIRDRRALFLSPTASGKSLMIYLIARYLNLKTLIIVPTINLCTQTKKFFEEYGYDEDIHVIYGGQSKSSDALLTITTWQSIYKMPRKWFEQFEVIFGDEAHGAKAKSMVSIMEKTPYIKYKFGFTGTLDDLQTNILVITGLFGPVIKVISTAKLMEKGHIAQLKIKAIVLDYPEVIRKMAAAYKYQDEIEFIIKNRHRNEFIRKLVLSLEGNTLILFRRVEDHGKVLYDILKDCGRNVYYASGETDVEERELIRQTIAIETNCIFVASEGTFSTGADMPQIRNVIFASPTKSKIKVLQSIGRGLRKAAGKFFCTLYDISDDLSWKSHKNYTLQHFMSRVKIYATEKFDYKIYRVKTKA